MRDSTEGKVQVLRSTQSLASDSGCSTHPFCPFSGRYRSLAPLGRGQVAVASLFRWKYSAKLWRRRARIFNPISAFSRRFIISMSFIYYACVAEGHKIVHEAGESSKYRRYAELIVSRCSNQRRCFEIADTTPEVIITVTGDLSTTWIVVTDSEVQLTLPFSFLYSLQQPWRSINRPQHFSRVIEEKIALYTSTNEEKQAAVLQEVAEFGNAADGVNLEPFNTLIKRNENLDQILIELDNQVTDTPEIRSKESRQRLRFFLTVAAGLAAIVWAGAFVACGISGERCR